MPDPNRTRLADDLADTIGADGLARLIAYCGGARLTVHSAPRPDSDLALALGPAYHPLQSTYAGCAFDVPLCGTWVRHIPEQAILSDLAAGLSADRIAPRYRISRRRVFRIQARHQQKSLR